MHQHDNQEYTDHRKMTSHRGHDNHHVRMVADFKKRFWVSLVVTIPILILSPLIQGLLGITEALYFTGDSYLLWALSSFIFFYGGYPFLKGIFEELNARNPGMMTLIALAIVTAYTYSSAVVFGLSGKVFFWELASLIDVMLLGHWIEMKSIMGASKALEELARLMPSDAHKLLPDGSMKDVPLGDLIKGDKIVVKPGEKIPADGEVIEGETSVSEAMLTGESKPVTKQMKSKVIGGSINGEGSISVEVHSTGSDSYLSQVIDLVKQAQESKSKTQDLASRAARWLTIIGISSGVTTIIVWLFAINQEAVFALERMVTVLVITCPHALGLAVPLVVAVSTAILARNGLLIRNRAAFERARNIEAIVFDKTGTLTLGEFGVTNVIPLEKDINEEELLKYAVSVEIFSEHPIARGITSSSKHKLPSQEFKAIPGKGAQAVVNGKKVTVVSLGYLSEKQIKIDSNKIIELEEQGKTIVYVMIEGNLKGAIALGDKIRPESREAIAKLKALGIKCMMITGDNKQVAKWVANKVGLDEYFAEVLPNQKAQKIREIQSRGLIVAMTGDGVNDAPALAQADIGIAIGAGTDVAIETSDIILTKSNPLDMLAIVSLAKATYKKMIQNLGWAVGYNIVAIPLAAGVLFHYGILLTPALGALLMSLSTVIVAVNARFLRI